MNTSQHKEALARANFILVPIIQRRKIFCQNKNKRLADLADDLHKKFALTKTVTLSYIINHLESGEAWVSLYQKSPDKLVIQKERFLIFAEEIGISKEQAQRLIQSMDKIMQKALSGHLFLPISVLSA